MLQDLRHAFRQMGRQPVHHAAIVITLALGIGANAAIFGVIESVLLGSVAMGDPAEAVRIWMRNDARGAQRVASSLQDFEDVRDNVRTVNVAAYTAREGNLARDGGADRIAYALVTAGFFDVVATPPFRGRSFTSEDDATGAGDVVVVSHGFWQERLGGVPDAIGRSVFLDGAPVTIVGVAPAGFAYPDDEVVLWKPLAMHGDEAGSRGGRWLDVIARLRPGATIDQANAELGSFAAGLAEAHPETNRDWNAWAEPIHDVAVGNVRETLLIVWSVIGLVLLIACANVANLMLARAFARDREMAVRLALGARRSRLIRQMLVESMAAAGLGGAGALLIAQPLVRLMASLGQTTIPAGTEPGLDGRVMLYTAAITILTGLLVGLLPAIRGTERSPGHALRSARGAAGTRSKLRMGLVAVELALATVVLIGAGLYVRSLAAFGAVDAGIATENRLTLRVAPGWATRPERPQAEQLYGAIEEGIRAIPGVRSVGAINRLPLEGPWWGTTLSFRDRPPVPAPDRPRVLARVITTGYVEAAGLTLLRGRPLTSTDDANGQRVALISESTAHRHWPGGDPIGQIVTTEDPGNPASAWFTIVGIVSDVRYTGLAAEPDDVVYVTFAQGRFGHFGDWGMALIIETTGDPLARVDDVRDAIAAVDPGLPAFEMSTMRGRTDALLATYRYTVRLLTAFGCLALVLAALGTYAVIAFDVARQRGEIGVRIALGASRGNVARLVLARGMVPAGIGTIAGIVAAAALSPLVEEQIFGIAAIDAFTFVAIGLGLLATAALACWLPARRAMHMSPGEALSTEA
jgi:putative ABC transport system permease protein